MNERVAQRADDGGGLETAGDRYVLKPGPSDLGGRPRCLKTRWLPCEEAIFDALADRYHRHLGRAFGDRGDEVALAIREELMNYFEHSGARDPNRLLKIVSCRIGTHLVFFWSMETDRTFDPSHRSSGPHRGHGLRIIHDFADGHVVDHVEDAATGTGSTTIYDLARNRG